MFKYDYMSLRRALSGKIYSSTIPLVKVPLRKKIEEIIYNFKKEENLSKTFYILL